MWKNTEGCTSSTIVYEAFCTTEKSSNLNVQEFEKKKWFLKTLNILNTDFPVVYNFNCSLQYKVISAYVSWFS